MCVCVRVFIDATYVFSALVVVKFLYIYLYNYMYIEMFLGGLIEIASVVSNALDSSNKTVSNKRCKSSTTVRGRFEGV